MPESDRPRQDRARRRKDGQKSDRLAEALRANLARRKAQKRARDADSESESGKEQG